VAQLGDPAACREVYERWPSYTSAARREVLAVSTFSPAAAAALLDALEAQQVAPVEVPQSVRDSLARLPGEGLAGRARKILAASATADRQNVIDRYQTALTLAGDQRRGAALFKEHCATCHAIQGVGQKVGPDLAAVGSRRNDILLVDILDPSRQVSADFLGYVLATRGGKVLTGMVTAETAGGVTLRREGGVEESIARTEIEELRPSGKSLMPEGFEQKMRPEQIADILEFLRRPDPALLR
jgi:putative heme-binding domain-containing protein